MGSVTLTPDIVMKDPDFLGLPDPEKIKVLQQVDPQGFGQMAADQQQAVVTQLQPNPAPSVFTPQEATYQQQTYGPTTLSAVLPNMIRMAPGLIRNPFVAGPVSAGAEYAAERLPAPFGEGRPEASPTEVGIAGAVPPLVAGPARVARAAGRTATMFVPSLFERAQNQATQAFQATVQAIRPTVSVDEAFQAARQAGVDRVPVGPLQKVVEGLDQFSVAADPTDPKLKLVRQMIDSIKGQVADDGTISLADANKLREELGSLVGSLRDQAPKARAMLRGLFDSLESAQTGGPLMTAVETARLQRGANLLQKLGSGPPARMMRPLEGPAPTNPPWNVSALGNKINQPKVREELTRVLGDKMALVDGFIDRFKNLPPAQGNTAWTSLMGILSAVGGGALGTGAGVAAGHPIIGGLMGALSPAAVEIARNIPAVGTNPAVLNKVLDLLALGSYAAMRSTPVPPASPPGMPGPPPAGTQ